MGIRQRGFLSGKQVFVQALLNANLANVADVRKGHLAVYVGESQRKRFLVPISFVNKPQFQQLLRKAEDEFGYNHPMGGLTLPCKEDTFLDLISHLSG